MPEIVRRDTVAPMEARKDAETKWRQQEQAAVRFKVGHQARYSGAALLKGNHKDRLFHFLDAEDELGFLQGRPLQIMR